jgi:RimJ/RimL family protein N-acetyltransferase
MAISISILRITDYYRRHGLAATLGRIGQGVRRLFSTRMVVFCCDLAKTALPSAELPSGLKVERKNRLDELTPDEREALTAYWNPRLARRNMKERFGKGASLWLIKSQNIVAGFSWTIRGGTIAPFYFPMAEDDVQFFDWAVFPKFRGRAILFFLVTQILGRLQAEGAARAFGDAAEWNQASLAAYKMLPFRRLGIAKKFIFMDRHIIVWSCKSKPQSADR